MNKFVAAASLCLFTLLEGCATQWASMDTINGKPEVTLPTISAQQVKDYLKDRMINMGFGLEKDSELQLVFGRRGKQPLIQSSWGYRVTYSIIDQQPGVRVVADVIMVSDQGTARERPYEAGLTQPTDDPQAAVQRQIEGVLRALAYMPEIAKAKQKKAG
jgi:hypothetical protein